MYNSVGKGAIILTISGLLCKFFGALFRLPLTNIIGIEGIALFQMVMTIYSFALVCVSGGVTNSLAKLVSSARARGDANAIGGYLKQALRFSLGLSTCFGVVLLLFATQIASLQGATNAVASYRLLALLIPLGALVGVARGVLQGYGNMTPTAISQIIEQVVKFAFGLIFAYLLNSQGATGGVLGAVIGIAISEVFACVYLGIRLFKVDKFSLLNQHSKRFMAVCLPITFGGLVVPLTHTIEALFIVKLFMFSGIGEDFAKIIYGLQTGVVGAILNFPLIISLAVAAALLPNLSYLAEHGEVDKQKRTITNALTSMWFLLIPFVFGIVSISRSIYPLIYPEVMKQHLVLAVQLTAVNAFAIVCTAFMQQLVSVLQANGHFKDTLVFYIIGGAVKVALLVIFALIPSVAAYSIAISNLALAAVVSICVLIKLKELITMPVVETLLPIMASVVMFLVVKIITLNVESIWGVFLAVVVGGSIYFVLAFPLTGKYVKILGESIKKHYK